MPKLSRVVATMAVIIAGCTATREAPPPATEKPRVSPADVSAVAAAPLDAATGETGPLDAATEPGPLDAAPRTVTIGGEVVEVLAAGATPPRDGYFLDESRSATSPNHARLIAQVDRDAPAATRGAQVRMFVQVRQAGGVTYAERPCGSPLMRVWITSDRMRVAHWETQDYALDRAKLGTAGFELAITRASMAASRHPDWVPTSARVVGRIVAREPSLYEIDLGGTFSFLAVERHDLARLPLVINECKLAKRPGLPGMR